MERVAASGVRCPKDFLNGTDETLLEKDEDDDPEESEKAENTIDEIETATSEVHHPLLYEESLWNCPQVLGNSTGWSWVSGVTGKGTSCAEAMENALDILQGTKLNQKSFLTLYIHRQIYK
jgi:hypothetical protein